MADLGVCPRITELEAQRDELLRALADIAENETMSANATVKRMANAARAAIAKCQAKP